MGEKLTINPARCLFFWLGKTSGSGRLLGTFPATATATVDPREWRFFSGLIICSVDAAQHIPVGSRTGTGARETALVRRHSRLVRSGGLGRKGNLGSRRLAPKGRRRRSDRRSPSG